MLREPGPHQGLIEVLEYWTNERVITVGNAQGRALRDIPNPFRHGRKPFVVCSAMPDAFQIPGISVVEALAQLQEYALDAPEPAPRRAPAAGQPDHPDPLRRRRPRRVRVLPGRAVVRGGSRPGDARCRSTRTSASITLEAEALIKGDLQNIMGGLPCAGGRLKRASTRRPRPACRSSPRSPQRMIQARKQHYIWAFGQIGEQFLLDDGAVPPRGAA